jgi:hypothetical protein
MRVAIVAAALCTTVGASSSPAQAQYGYGGDRPPGSYAATCRRIGMDGPFLRAVCRDRYGDWRETSIDARRCRSFSNLNGRLACGR